MKLSIFVRFLCFVAVLIVVFVGYLWLGSQPKQLSYLNYPSPQNIDQSSQPKIEFVKKYYEAVKNGDKAKVKDWSVGNFPFQNNEDKDRQFEKYWAKYGGRNFIFSRIIDSSEYDISCEVVEVKEGENKFWFCVDAGGSDNWRMVMYPEEIKLSRLELRKTDSQKGINLDSARKGFSEQYFRALTSRDISTLKKLTPSDFDTPDKEKKMGEAAQRFYDRFWEISGGKTVFVDKIINGKFLECNRTVFITHNMNTQQDFFYSYCIKDIDPNNGLFSIDIIAEPMKENITREQLKAEYEESNKK